MSFYDTIKAQGCTSWYQLHNSAYNQIDKTTGTIIGTLSSYMLKNRGVAGLFDKSTYLDDLTDLSSQTFTLFIWIMQTNSAATNSYNTIYETSNSSVTSYVRLRIDSNNNLIAMLRNGDTSTTLIAPVPLVNDVWYNIAITHTTNKFSLYINGVMVITNNSLTLDISNQTYTTIGCQAVAKSNLFSGYMKNFFIFSSVLDDNQIKKLYYLTYIN